MRQHPPWNDSLNQKMKFETESKLNRDNKTIEVLMMRIIIGVLESHMSCQSLFWTESIAGSTSIWRTIVRLHCSSFLVNCYLLFRSDLPSQRWLCCALSDKVLYLWANSGSTTFTSNPSFILVRLPCSFLISICSDTVLSKGPNSLPKFDSFHHGSQNNLFEANAFTLVWKTRDFWITEKVIREEDFSEEETHLTLI